MTRGEEMARRHPEAAHSRADHMLCAVLDGLGYGQMVNRRHLFALLGGAALAPILPKVPVNYAAARIAEDNAALGLMGRRFAQDFFYGLKRGPVFTWELPGPHPPQSEWLVSWSHVNDPTSFGVKP